MPLPAEWITMTRISGRHSCRSMPSPDWPRTSSGTTTARCFTMLVYLSKMRSISWDMPTQWQHSAYTHISTRWTHPLPSSLRITWPVLDQSLSNWRHFDDHSFTTQFVRAHSYKLISALDSMIFIIGFVIFDNISPHNFASRATVYTDAWIKVASSVNWYQINLFWENPNPEEAENNPRSRSEYHIYAIIYTYMYF